MSLGVRRQTGCSYVQLKNGAISLTLRKAQAWP